MATVHEGYVTKQEFNRAGAYRGNDLAYQRGNLTLKEYKQANKGRLDMKYEEKPSLKK